MTVRCWVQRGLARALSLGAAAVVGCSVSPDAGNPDNVGAVAPPPIHSMVNVPRPPRSITFDPQPDGGALDAALVDGGTLDAAITDGASQSSVDGGPAVARAQLDAVVASFNASVELECACLWSAPGYRYVSQATCVAAGKLDAASASCVRAELAEASDEILDCKLDAERVMRACLADDCTEAAALACVDAWADADEACDPGLAAAVYDTCLASGA